MINEYVRLFGDEPYLEYSFTYEKEPYKSLIRKAIKRKSPLTKQEIEKALDNYIYDDQAGFDSEEYEDEEL